MKIDFNKVLLDADDKPIKAREGSEEPATLLLVAKVALQESAQQDTPESKLKAFDLLMHVRKGGVVEITPEQSAMLKERVGRVYGPLIYGRATEILNG